MSDYLDEEEYCDAADENRNIVDLYEKYGTPERFLERDERVYARAVVVKSKEVELLDISCDLDGCVVEIRNVGKVDIPVRHLTFFPKGVVDVRPIKPMLKKHFDLTVYSAEELYNFGHSVGFQLFYERGWEGWIGLIPKHKSGSVKMKEEVIRQSSFEIFQVMKSRMQKQLLRCLLKGSAVNTLAKNDVNDIGRITVLPDDVRIIMSSLQDVLDAHNSEEFELICFCFRFGEKLSSGLSLAEFGPENIIRATVHSAVNISCCQKVISLLWSVDGLQQVVGSRGTLSTCLSFTDCANYQSNLDGRCIDIRHELRRVCVHPERVRFVQLYADIPHRMPNTRYHPVSGSIAFGLVAPQQTSEAFSRDADRYISTLECNLMAIRNGICRLEIVLELPTFPSVVYAKDYVDTDNLISLLKTRPMLVPFADGCLSCVQSIGLWATKNLRELKTDFKNTGNVEATWKAFQLELALEKLLWGHPLCFRSGIYSRNLGPGELSPGRSASDNLGFLSLTPSTSCMSSDDSIPYTAIWTQSDEYGKMIRRSVGFHDHINASHGVIGRRLVYALLQDLLEERKVSCSFNELLAALKSDRPNLTVVGAIQLEQLVKLLSESRRMGIRTVYGHLCRLVTEKGIAVHVAVEKGIKELGLRTFPALETYDVHRHSCLRWTAVGKFWSIVLAADGLSILQTESPVQVSALVKTDIERRGLIYPSKLKKSPVCMPWIYICRSKLAQEKLTNEQMISVLTFISCIAFIMEGWYIEYERLSTLIKELPVSQARLRDLEILSKLLLSGVHREKVYRLHWSIPHAIGPPPKAGTSSSDKSQVVRDQTSEDNTEEKMQALMKPSRITEDDSAVNEHDIQLRHVSCAPAGFSRMPRWSGLELEFLHDLNSNKNNRTIPELYTAFKNRCIEHGIPFRTFLAFKTRFMRL